MNLFQSSNRALSIGLIGLKEAFMAVAERVARRVQVAKLRLHEDLQAGGGTVERVTIAPGIGADGRRLADLSLPESVGIVLIRRGEALLFPYAETVLKAGDQVTLVGRRSAMPAALQSLRA